MTPPNTSKVPSGTVLGEKFRITKEIGRGGMAAVYEAENVQIGKRVAVKILAAELVKSKVVTGRFLREARAMAAIKSPYICEVYDSGEYDNRPFMVLELLEGESLYDLLSRKRRLDIELTLKIAIQCAMGLSKAHEINVVHRDLKPENMFLTKGEDGGIRVKLLDFGLAKFYDNTKDEKEIRLTREGALFGTPAYMSPEQAKGIDEVDHRTDLWALGCIVYECLTGKTVWNADQGVAMILAQIAGAPVPRPSRLRPDVPASFDEWFQKALDRNPDKRFQNSHEFSTSLKVALKPPAGSVKRVPLPSIEEGEVVDDLVKHSRVNLGGSLEPVDLRSDGRSSGGMVASSSDSVETHPGVHDTPSEAKVVDSLPPPKQKVGGVGRAIVALLTFAVLSVGGYAGWLYIAHPPNVGELKAVARPLDIIDDETVVDRKPVETEPFALQIASAQERLAKGERKDAMTMFREAFKAGGHRAAQSLMYQAQIGFGDGDNGKCKVTGLGRPRPFNVVVPVSRPSMVLSEAGPLIAWADNHEDKKKRRGFAVLLDEALRRVTPAHLVTPEAHAIRQPILVDAGKRVALIYFDNGEKSPGVYVRLLKRDGRIAGPARLISDESREQFYPSLTLADDGTYWAVWEQGLTHGVEDLVARHLSSQLEPLGEPLRLTAYKPTKGIETKVQTPDVAVAHGKLQIVYSFQRDRDFQIQLMSIDLDDAALEKGLPEEKDAKEDRVVGKVVPLGPQGGKNRQPRIACTDEGCYVTWDDETAGAFAAFVEKDQTEALWHREFSAKGARPALAIGGDNAAAVTWYGGGRLKLARIHRDGVDPESSIARVSGYQPHASVVAGEKTGQWYICWRDYESGTHESFIVRAECE